MENEEVGDNYHQTLPCVPINKNDIGPHTHGRMLTDTPWEKHSS